MDFKKYRKKFQSFLKVFAKNKKLKINLVLLSLFFLIFPTQNAYQAWQFDPNGRPLARNIDINFGPLKDYPVNKTGAKPPRLVASSALIIDIPSKTILFSKNPDEKLLPASTTKIMTALVSLDTFKPDDLLEVKNTYIVGQVVGLKQGQKMSFRNLLYALLVDSGNDAAEILAQNDPQGETAFIEKMNKKAEELQLHDTHFTNVSGLDAYNHRTTAHDLALLTATALHDPIFAETVSTKTVQIEDATGENFYTLENTNKLVGTVSGVRGVKTGWTENAGECLVTYTKRNGKDIITVVLGSNDRFGESTRLIDWVYDNFEWRTINTKDQ